MIITDLNLLQTPAEPLEFLTEAGTQREEGEEIIAKLKAVMEEKILITLAAPQIGINKRIFCIRFADQIKAFINPIITKKTGSIIGPETFNSLPGKEILIARPEEIRAVYYTDDFKYEDNKFLKTAARLFDQQCQILDGILPNELGLVSDIEEDGSLWDLTDGEFNQVVEVYKEFVKTKTKAFNEAISEAEQGAYKNLKFSEDVINGRTEVQEDPRRLREQQNRYVQAQNKETFNNFLKGKRK